ncbi:MAG TPA: hypothetical protein VNL94_06690 [Candidatus Binatia bacterium]|nr:hypothetical protein [Candidatus Binatia bacterium]
MSGPGRPFIRPDRDPTGAPMLPATGGLDAPEPRLPEPESPDQLPGERPAAKPAGAKPAAAEPAAAEPAAAELVANPTAGEAAGEQPPPDPEAYDSPRAKQARARGLSAPYIAGGTDPNPEPGRREERRLGILLIAMVVVVVLAGFVLGIIQNLLGV